MSRPFDLAEYIEDNLDFQKSGKHLCIDCISEECEDSWEMKKHLYVDPEKRIGYCYKCNKSFKAEHIVMATEKCSWSAAIRKVAEGKARRREAEEVESHFKAAMEERKKKKEEPAEPSKPPPELVLPPTIKIDTPLLATAAKAYLDKRGFPASVVEHFKLRFCKNPDHPFHDRIIIPVHSNGRVVGYQGRDVTGKADPKYLFPLTFQPGDEVRVIKTGETGKVVGYFHWQVRVMLESGERRLCWFKELRNLTTETEARPSAYANYLYNWDEARNYPWIILVEGVTDCWRVWMSGLKNVAATFGKSFKVNQRKAILERPNIKMVMWMWDGNALDKAYEAAGTIYPQKQVCIVTLPYHMEPDTCDRLFDRVREARPYEGLTKLELLNHMRRTKRAA